jgi:DNA polymerase III subunit gamma/tau
VPESPSQSLYRRHRPRTFADVVGQTAVVRTLRNAVEQDKVHHAYLFVGSRGTGKTSMAKILAAGLNCEQGPTIDPCGRCDSCRSIAQATSLDVIEMDAASNNSVEDIRELRESVAFAPVSGRHKVYILDEAHMLSQAAWNAFLKTLEEPPPSTVFVLATTEAQKVPATVVDRCHRFDFQRPSVEQIASVLERVAAAEGIGIGKEAVAAIARSATGSFRDALGTLEQLVTYSGAEVALDDVLAVLGVASEQLLAAAFDAVCAKDARAALLAVASCVEAGRDASAFTRDLEARARELLVVQTLSCVPSELSLTAERDERLLEQAQRIAAAEVVRLLDLLGAAMEAVRAGAEPRTQLELALVKAATPQTDGSMRALLARIERLEQSLSEEAAPGALLEPQTHGSGRLDAQKEKDEEPVSAAGATAARRTAMGRAAAGSSAAEMEPAAEPAQATPGAPPAASAVPESLDLDAIWPAVLESVRSEHALLGAALAEASPAKLSGEEIELAFGSGAAFHKRTAESPANRTILLEALKRLTGRRYTVVLELRPELDGDPPAAQPLGEEEVLARLMTELDAEELPDSTAIQPRSE